MDMAFVTKVAVLALFVAVAVAQHYSGSNSGNYVDDDYDYDQPAPRTSSPPIRSFSRPPPPSPSRSSSSSNAPRPTPVPILKQINRHNEDGSYTYGFEGADGSFKIETKLSTGEVMGKYGYVDDLGKVRVVEYGANRYGFQPSGEGITVAPPTLVDESTRREGEYDDGRYYAPVAQRAPPRQQPRLPPRPVAGPQPIRAASAPPRPAPQPRPSPPLQQLSAFDAYPEEPPFRPPPPQAQTSNGPGPVPPRAQIPGAAPTGGVHYSSQPRPSGPPPPPPRPLHQHQTPVYHAQPIAPAPVLAPAPPPAPVHVPRPVSRPPPQTRQVGSLLDQLAKDYALPQGSQPLHDISFGYYS